VNSPQLGAPKVIRCNYWSLGESRAGKTFTVSSTLIRWGGFAAIAAGLLYFVGYAGMAELLQPIMSNLGGHVVLGLAGLAALLALVGVLARDAGHSARLGAAGYVLSFVGVAVFSVGTLAEGVWLVESGVVLFEVGLLVLTVGVVVLGLGVSRAKVLPAWAVWPLVVGWMAFLPVANSPNFLDFDLLVASLLAAGMLGIGWVAVGLALWLGQTASAQQRARGR
jgi:hypothetical protein